MPITITNRRLLESAPAIRELGAMPLPLRTALKLRKMMRLVQEDLNDAQELIREQAVKFALKDADGNMIHPDGDKNRVEIDPAQRAAYDKAVEALLDAEVELDFKQVKAEDMVDPGDPPLKIKTSLVFTLDWLFEDKE